MSLLAEDDDSTLHVFYTFIAEDADGFRWQVRSHGLAEPIESGHQVFASDADARAAAHAALDKACEQVRRYAATKRRPQRPGPIVARRPCG